MPTKEPVRCLAAEFVEIDGMLYVWLPEINVKLAVEKPPLALAA